MKTLNLFLKILSKLSDCDCFREHVKVQTIILARYFGKNTRCSEIFLSSTLGNFVISFYVC